MESYFGKSRNYNGRFWKLTLFRYSQIERFRNFLRLISLENIHTVITHQLSIFLIFWEPFLCRLSDKAGPEVLAPQESYPGGAPKYFPFIEYYDPQNKTNISFDTLTYSASRTENHKLLSSPSRAAGSNKNPINLDILTGSKQQTNLLNFPNPSSLRRINAR